MSTLIEEKSAKGEILLWERWSEVQSGYQPETTEGAKLEVSPEGKIVLVEYSHYISFAPHVGSDHNEHKTEVSVEDLISAIKQCSEKSKIQHFIESITNWEPNNQTVMELHDLITQAKKVKEFTCGELRPTVRFSSSYMDQFNEKDNPAPCDVEETINELEYEIGEDIVIGCDFNGDCLLEHGFDFFDDEECTTEMTIESIDEIWNKVNNFQHFNYISSKDD
jgi:hypothetical protein